MPSSSFLVRVNPQWILFNPADPDLQLPRPPRKSRNSTASLPFSGIQTAIRAMRLKLQSASRQLALPTKSSQIPTSVANMTCPERFQIRPLLVRLALLTLRAIPGQTSASNGSHRLNAATLDMPALPAHRLHRALLPTVPQGIRTLSIPSLRQTRPNRIPARTKTG